VDGLTTTEGAIALAAAVLAVVGLGLSTVLAFRLRRLREGQRLVLGDAGERDLVDHAARLERGFVELRDWVEDTAAGIERRMATAEARIDGCVAHRSLIRYDAYGEQSGHQSSSLALLDDHRSGVVVSSIHHRDSARVYVKQIVAGRPELELSPEEQEAVDTALRTSVEATADR
jgi:hypothetical protein